jgi:hypothetical protein
METTIDFRIRYDLICDDFFKTSNWRQTDCAKDLAMSLERSWKSVENLYLDFINNPLQAWKIDEEYVVGEESNAIRTFRDVLEKGDRKTMRETLTSDFYVSPNNYYWIMPNQYRGINLFIEEEIAIDNPIFLIAFYFRFTKTKLRNDFLDFHYKETYKKDWRKFALLITEAILNKADEKEKIYLTKYLENKPEVTVANELPQLTFESAFRKKEYYKQIIDIFSKPEAGGLFNTKGDWIRRKKDSVSHSLVLIETLYNKKYFLETIELSNETKIKFCLLWFGVKISKKTSSLKKSQPELKQRFNSLIGNPS